MSYVVSPYLIDLTKLRTAIGSANAFLVDDVAEDNPDDFDTGSNDEISLRQALTHLVFGNRLDERMAHRYGYALERLCRHLGTRLDSGLWDAVRWRTLEATGLDRIFEESGSPVPLPRIPDFPGIGYISVEQLSAALREAENQQRDSGDADLRDLLTEFKSWLEEAAQRRRSLVLFYY